MFYKSKASLFGKYKFPFKLHKNKNALMSQVTRYFSGSTHFIHHYTLYLMHYIKSWLKYYSFSKEAWFHISRAAKVAVSLSKLLGNDDVCVKAGPLLTVSVPLKESNVRIHTTHIHHWHVWRRQNLRQQQPHIIKTMLL